MEEQAQSVLRLKQFTKAFRHFFQKLGTLSAFAFVVVIAFQVLVVDSQLRRGEFLSTRTDCLVFKDESWAAGPRLIHIDNPIPKMFNATDSTLERSRPANDVSPDLRRIN